MSKISNKGNNMIPKTISHYNILSKLGEGGMGEVYLAEDTKLKRKVALKFLPAQMTKDKSAVERFKREAQAAAALNHPNIVTIYEIGEHEGQIYIAMEHVDGHSLREEIEKGSMEVEKVVNVIKQICEGLDKAHKADIVHRDIKPENILIDTDGRVRILDFGLARMKGVSKLTKESSTLGTVKYMSPEQLKGETVDQRTDIWSLGVVMYEMLTGEVPFKGEYEQAVVYSILNETISPQTDIPNDFGTIIRKILNKNQADRYQNVQEIGKELRTITTANHKDKNQKSIIVLPFENMSSDPEQEYFSDGLTEEIITDLSHIHDLLVISRNSAMTFKGSGKKTTDISREVNVQYVLEGSVRKAGNNLRITAQLIDAETDAHQWAEKYSGTLDDIFDIQEKVSRSIAEALKIKLSSREKEKIDQRPIEDLQAYEYYLRARQEVYSFSKEGLDRGIRYLESGLDIVGENSAIYAGLGYIYSQYVNIGLEQEEYIQKSVEYANKALELDSRSFEAHLVHGFLNMSFSDNPQKSLYHLKQAESISPDDAHVLLWLFAGCGINWGKREKARASFNRLKQVDPFNLLSQFPWMLDVWVESTFDLSVEYITNYIQKEPDNPMVIFYTSFCLAYCLHFEEAILFVEKHVRKDMKDFCSITSLLLKLAIGGNTKGIDQLLTTDYIKTARRDGQYSYFVSSLFALAGMGEKAFDWLENAINKGFINYPFMNEYDPLLENIRGEKRFKKLMKQVKYEWENFEV
ncbi:hypothetical protein BVY01_04455 [bacterium I07]|nr:hypothetical protein BVY01_04455 [bacterium I07]